MKIKIVVVSYVNSTPLWWTLKDKNWVELFFEKPSNISSLFQDKSFDLALLPTYEFVKKNYLIAAPYGILSNGKVKSVVLFHKSNITEIEKIYLDPESKTSNAMTKFLFQNKGVKFIKKIKNLNELKCKEAQLLIGDKALKETKSELKKIDIASLWKKRTKHPALFALWAKKNKNLSCDYETLLAESYEKSLKKLDEILNWAEEKTKIKKIFLRNYFTKSLSFHLGEEGKKALDFYKETFYEKKY